MSKEWTSSGTAFEQPPVGIHTAVCIRIIDLGTQENEFKGEKSVRRQNLITWELPDELRNDGQPFIISKFYTASLSEKANLFKDLTGWLGKAPEAPFNPEALLGKGCQVMLVEKNDKVVVDKVVALGKAAKLPKKTHNATVFFSLDAFDEDVFAEISEGLQKIIMKSPEYDEAVNGPADAEDESEETPF